MEELNDINLEQEILNQSTNIVVVDNVSNDTNNLQLSDSSYCLPLRINSFSDEKEQHLFIKNVEKLVRSSIEYKMWVDYVTETLGYNKCALTNEKMSECTLDVHHHPITLYTIVKSVINDYISKEAPFSTYDVSLKTIELHYQNKIGFIVLLSNLHEKYHNGFQNLPIEYTHGDYKHLLDNYHFEDEELESIRQLMNTNLKDSNVSWIRDNYPGQVETNA